MSKVYANAIDTVARSLLNEVAHNAITQRPNEDRAKYPNLDDTDWYKVKRQALALVRDLTESDSEEYKAAYAYLGVKAEERCNG